MSTARVQQQPTAAIPTQLEQDIKVYITKAMESLQLGRIGDSQNDDLRLSEPMHRSSGKEEYRQTQSEDGGNKGTTSQYRSQGNQNSQNFDRRQWKSEFQDPDGHDPQSSSSSYSGPHRQPRFKSRERSRPEDSAHDNRDLRKEQARQMTGAVVVPTFGTGSYDDNQQAFRSWSQLGDKGSEFMASHIRKVFSTRLREPITEESWKYALNTLLNEGPGNDCSDFLHESLQTIVDMLIAKYDRSHDRPSDIMRSIETIRRSANQTLFKFRDCLEVLLCKIKYTMTTEEFRVFRDRMLREKLLAAVGPRTSRVLQKANCQRGKSLHEGPNGRTLDGGGHGRRRGEGLCTTKEASRKDKCHSLRQRRRRSPGTQP